MEAFSWAKIPTNSQRWGMSMYDMSVSGINVAGMIMDSGTSYILCGTADLSAVASHVRGRKSDASVSGDLISSPCTSSTNLDNDFPEIKFTLGNEQGSAIITMKGSQYMKFSGSTCTSEIRSLSSLDSENFWLLGTPFYRAMEVAHDLAGQKVGFRSTGKAGVALGNPLVTGAFKMTMNIAALGGLAIVSALI